MRQRPNPSMVPPTAPGAADRSMIHAIGAWRVRPEAVNLCRCVREALIEQAIDWDARPFLERQLMLREFRVRTGKPVAAWLEDLGQLERELIAGPGRDVVAVPLDRLAAFYDHLGDVDVAVVEPAWRNPEFRSADCRARIVRRLADLLEPVHLVAAT